MTNVISYDDVRIDAAEVSISAALQRHEPEKKEQHPTSRSADPLTKDAYIYRTSLTSQILRLSLLTAS